MKFKNRIRRFKNIVKKPQTLKSNRSLYLVILMPIVLNLLATIGIIEYCSIKATDKSINNLVDHHANNISDRLLSHLASSDDRSSKSSAQISIQKIDRYLAELKFSYASQVAVINQDGSVIADNFRNLAGNSPVSSQDLSRSLLQEFDTFSRPNQPQALSLVIKQQDFVGQIRPWHNQELGSNWLVVIIPRSQLLLDSVTKQSNQLGKYFIYILSAIPSSLLTCFWLTRSLKNWNQLKDQEATSEAQEQDLALNNSSDLAAEKAAQTVNPEPYILLANMSHELRSPLNAILGFAQIMEQELSMTIASQENLAIIHRSGEDLLSIINDVVDLAKIEINRLTLEHNKVDFQAWLDNIEQSLKFLARDQGWEFSLVRQHNLPQGICIDDRRLRQVLRNIIDYCLFESTPSTQTSTMISLQVTSSSLEEASQQQSGTKHNLLFQVENAAAVLNSSELASLFDPIARVRQEKGSTASSSLNLPLSRKLAQLMGGDISVSHSSISGTGILFNLEIQAKSAQAEASQIQSTLRRIIGLESNQTKYRILIVDDSKTNRMIMSRLLEPVGFEIEEAVNGKEAIDIWLRWQPHMIWMDLRMPVMNGYEATERIKSYAHTWHTPIVALSASTLEEEKSLFKAAGCDDFVGKPFSENVIFDKIAQHLGIRYVYEAVSPTSQNNFRSKFKLTADTLKIMPNQWLNQLELAALMLDRDALNQLLQQIPAEHVDFKNALQKQINDFDFDEILSLITSSKNN
jgi:CheY-like chemotaxis protein